MASPRCDPSTASTTVVAVAAEPRSAKRRHLSLVSAEPSIRAGGRSERVSALLAELASCSDAAERHRIQSEVAVATLPVAKSIASRYRGRGVDIGDLEQIAALGLVKAARRWKPGLSEDFLQYAVPTISGEIKRYFRDCWWTVRPPRRLQEARAAVGQAEQDLRQRTGREPDDHQLAAELGIDLCTVRQAKAVRQCSRPSSLEDPASDNGVIDQALAGEDRDLQRAENRIAVQTLLRTLSARDREVIDMRYFRGWSQARIGEHIGVSQMQVSRILRGICVTLRERWEN
ncbi:MAG: sigma-70 family RNA polymerase sigma factor [Actinomycetota bacterium]|nr:sigma-70 family RNA polymerase sigma factor [Actinomycetota bacterium]